MIPPCDGMDGEWKKALRLVRAAHGETPGAAREAAVAAARAFLSGVADARLRSWARLLPPGADDKAVLCALVPLERADARARLSDADLGITTADAAPGAAAAARDSFPLAVAADNLRSALNLGSVFRTCDFFGVESLWLCGYTADPSHPQVARSALGAETAVPARRFGDVREAVAAAKAEGRFVIALETCRGAVAPEDLAPRFPALLLLGSERFGLDPDVVASADAVAAIPAHGVKNSLNVAVAFAVAAAALRRAHDRRAAASAR